MINLRILNRSDNLELLEKFLFIPGKNLKSNADRRTAESAWLRNALEVSLKPAVVRKVYV